jgi:cytochrome c553
MLRLTEDLSMDDFGGPMARAVAAAALLLAGCTTGRGPEPIREQMLAHFEVAADLREAAFLGDLNGVRRASNRLVDLERPGDLGPDQGRQLLPLARAARDAATAESVDGAARAAARVPRACADCHLANRVPLGDRLGVPPAPGGRGARRHALGLARAAGLLWNGVAGPSERLWQSGAAALRETGPLPPDMARALPAAYVDDADLRMQELAAIATTATAREDRDRVLADVFATCAGCHALLAGR